MVEYCCKQFEIEFEGCLLNYRENSEYGPMGYYFSCDCDSDEWYEDTSVLIFCPWCGIKLPENIKL